MIFIRTNTSNKDGLGHLSRSLILAEELAGKDKSIVVFLDNAPTSEITNFIGDIKVISLYDEEIHYKNEIEDASICSAIVSKITSKDVILIIDDYRFDYEWEKKIKNKFNNQCLIIAIDDTGERPHFSDVLIDAKWDKDNTKLRYQDLTRPSTVRLLGPAFNLSRALVLSESFKKNSCKTLLLSIGGGGDSSIYIRIINAIVEEKVSDEKILIYVVLGPYLSNKDDLYKLNIKNDLVEVVCVKNCSNLSSLMLGSDLYVGAIGGTFYESNALELPSITFELSDNQKNSISILEDYGHFMHLGNIGHINFPKLGKLINITLEQSNRLKRLLQNSQNIKLDGGGPKRVSKIIHSLLNHEILKDEEFNIKIKKCNQKNILESEFRKVDDSYINKYLHARNLDENRVNMLSSKKIELLDHYLWWMQSKRNSYVYLKNGVELLYIWEQNIAHLDKNYLIGGWFIANLVCTPMDSYYCVSEQLKRCDILYPGIPWISSIKKTNHFVQKMSEKFGFQLISRDSDEFCISQSIFSSNKPDEFNYYLRYSEMS